MNLTKSIYEPIKKLRLGTFSDLKKKVPVKVKGKVLQFSAQSEIFGKIALVSQSRRIDLKDVAISSTNGSSRTDIVFDVYNNDSIKNVERNRRCSNALSFKKIVGTNVVRQWNSFLGDNKNKNSLINFLLESWNSQVCKLLSVIVPS